MPQIYDPTYDNNNNIVGGIQEDIEDLNLRSNHN
jgi:hypothetical protein